MKWSERPICGNLFEGKARRIKCHPKNSNTSYRRLICSGREEFIRFIYERMDRENSRVGFFSILIKKDLQRYSFHKSFKKISIPSREVGKWTSCPSRNSLLDGSKTNEEADAGIYSAKPKTRISKSLGKQATGFHAEVAIHQCAKEISRHMVKGKSIVIYLYWHSNDVNSIKINLSTIKAWGARKTK